MGYSKQSNVYSIGEYALRGGILDVYVPEIKHPVRLDFFGPKLDKIRTLIHQARGQMDLLNDVKNISCV